MPANEPRYGILSDEMNEHLNKEMDRTTVKMTSLAEQDEAFCLSLSVDERLKVLEKLNHIGRLAAGYPDAQLDRKRVHAA